MSLIRIDHNPSRRQLAIFGAVWLVFFTVVGIVMHARGVSAMATVSVWIAAAGVPVIGWIAPSFMRIVYLGMAYLALPIGFVVSYLLLAAIYYLVLTPTGLLMRMLGHDPMNRRFDATTESYWIPRGGPEGVD